MLLGIFHAQGTKFWAKRQTQGLRNELKRESFVVQEDNHTRKFFIFQSNFVLQNKLM